MDTETTFFQSNDISVTNTRFIVGAQTFAIRGVTSVQAIKIPANYGDSLAFIFIGVIIALFGFANSLFVLGGLGILILFLGIWVVTRQKPIFAIVLRTASGEIKAYQSYDSSYISHIIEALNRSIISHG
jgi:hypothetical protein